MGAARHTQAMHRAGVRVLCFPPDVLIAVDVDPMELVLQVLVFNIGHVVDHFQHNKPGKHRQHEPLLEQNKAMERDSLVRLTSKSEMGACTMVEVMGLLAALLQELLT